VSPTQVSKQVTTPRDAALDALRSLSQVDGAEVSAVLAVTQVAGKPAEFAQLRATENAASAFHTVAQATATKLRECELIEYGPASFATDEQVMWLNVAAIPLLQEIDEGSAGLTELPLFKGSKSDVTNLRFAAVRTTNGDHQAVFVHTAVDPVARSKRLSVVVSRGVIDTPRNGDLVVIGREVAAVVV
jgi:hypothetical protein